MPEMTQECASSVQEKQQTCPDFILSSAHHMLNACRDVVRQVWRKPLSVRMKDNGHPVTQVDYALETLMISYIKEKRPKDGIMGEEFGVFNEGAEYTWFLDPISHTEGLVTGSTDFSIVISCMQGDECILGMIDQPVLGDRWVGAKGYAPTMNDQRTRIRKEVALEDAYIAADKEFLPAHIANKAMILVPQRAVSFGLLISGSLDAVIGRDMDVADYAAAVPLVESASGQITDLQGNAVTRETKGPVLATVCDQLHNELLKGLT